MRQLLAGQSRARSGAVETLFLGDVEQHCVIAQRAAVVEVRAEQRELERGLALRAMFLARPSQQLVRRESVPHHARGFGVAALVIERDAGILRGLAHAPLHRFQLFGRGAVLARDMRGAFLAFGGHVGIEFESVPADIGLDLALELREALLQAAPADEAPGAHDIGPDIDPQGSCFAHCSIHHCMR